MTKHTGNFYRKGYLMLYHLAGATIQIANLVSYSCHSHVFGVVQPNMKDNSHLVGAIFYFANPHLILCCF